MAPSKQVTSRVLMIRPARFGANPETAASNVYQLPTSGPDATLLPARARAEVDAYAAALRAAGVDVVVLDDTAEPHTPDAVFPNNWVSFHADGTVVTYPLLAPSRRREVRPELLEQLRAEHGVRWTRLVDLTPLAEDGAFLEGTGSLVLDRANHVAYACLSPRTTPAGLAAFAERLGFACVSFRAVDRGAEVYHTNVLMGIGPAFAVVCLEAIVDARERDAVRASLADSGHEVVPITSAQMGAFAGNLLALRSTRGEPLITLSRRAWGSLDGAQRRALERHGAVVLAPLDTIETHGGGSARCMLAELHP